MQSFTGFCIPDPAAAPPGTYDSRGNLLIRPPRFPQARGRERYQVRKQRVLEHGRTK